MSLDVLGLEFLFCWHCEELAHLDRCAAGDDGFASPRHGLIAYPPFTKTTNGRTGIRQAVEKSLALAAPQAIRSRHLVRLGSRRALLDPDPILRAVGADILAQLGVREAVAEYPFADESVPTLVSLLGDTEPHVTTSALYALGHL